MLQSQPNPDTKHNTSMISTLNNSRNYSGRTRHHFQQEGKRVNLLYANKSYKKTTIDWNQSVSTWRNTSPKISFTKGKRFQTTIPYSLDIIEPEIVDTKSKKSCTFGRGKKKPISEIVLRNAKEKPAPNAYFIAHLDEQTRNQSKGRTFSHGWKDYEKIYLKQRKDVYSPHFVKDNPGAKYQVREKPGKGKRAFSAYGRQKMYTQKMADDKRGVPGPHHKINDRHLYQTVGLNERSFTSGDRMDLSAPANYNPGPVYKIPGFCDIFIQTSKKNIGK